MVRGVTILFLITLFTMIKFELLPIKKKKKKTMMADPSLFWHSHIIFHLLQKSEKAVDV